MEGVFSERTHGEVFRTEGFALSLLSIININREKKRMLEQEPNLFNIILEIIGR